MVIGGDTIEDDVLVAVQIQLISNNHNLYNQQILTCKPVRLKRNCRIDTNTTIFTGITIEENPVIVAGAVVIENVKNNIAKLCQYRIDKQILLFQRFYQ